MRVTYYALRNIQVGDEMRRSGDLVPEAASWPYLSGYIQDGAVAPVLVATLPPEAQKMLREWETGEVEEDQDEVVVDAGPENVPDKTTVQPMGESPKPKGKP